MNVEISLGVARGKDIFKNSLNKGKAKITNKVTEFKKHDHSTQKKIIQSFVMGAGVFGVNWGVGSFIALNKPELAPVISSSGALDIGLAYTLNIAALSWNLYQQHRLLENKNIDMSQDISATGFFHGLGKKESLRERRRGRSYAAIIAPNVLFTVAALIKEGTILSIASQTTGLNGVKALKYVQAASNLAQGLGAEVALRTVGKKKKEKKVMDEVTVFDSKKLVETERIALAPVVREVEPK